MKYLCNKPAGALLTQTGIMTPNRILIYPASNYFNTKFSTATASYRPKNDSACWKGNPVEAAIHQHSLFIHPPPGDRTWTKKRLQYHSNAK